MTAPVTVDPPLSEIQKRLDGLQKNIQKKGMRLAVTAAVKPMTKRMREKVSVRTGALKRAIGYKTLSARSKSARGLLTKDFGLEAGVIKAVADPGYSRSPGKKIKQDYKAYFIEYGVRPHSVASGARRDRGKKQDQPPYHPGIDKKPFVVPAYNAELPNFGKNAMAQIDQFLKDI